MKSVFDKGEGVDKKTPGGKTGGFGVMLAASNIGLYFVVSVLIGAGMGYWLDKKFDTRPVFIIIFMLCGVASGFKNAYKFLKMSEKYLEQDEKDKK